MWWHTMTERRGMQWETVPFTLPRNMVYPTLLPLMRTPRLNWRPRRFKWTRPFRRKTKSDFCACAITFQLACTVWFTFIHHFHNLGQASRVYSWDFNRKSSESIPGHSIWDLCSTKWLRKIIFLGLSFSLLSELFHRFFLLFFIFSFP